MQAKAAAVRSPYTSPTRMNPLSFCQLFEAMALCNPPAFLRDSTARVLHDITSIVNEDSRRNSWRRQASDVSSSEKKGPLSTKPKDGSALEKKASDVCSFQTKESPVAEAVRERKDSIEPTEHPVQSTPQLTPRSNGNESSRPMFRDLGQTHIGRHGRLASRSSDGSDACPTQTPPARNITPPISSVWQSGGSSLDNNITTLEAESPSMRRKVPRPAVASPLCLRREKRLKEKRGANSVVGDGWKTGPVCAVNTREPDSVPVDCGVLLDDYVRPS